MVDTSSLSGVMAASGYSSSNSSNVSSSLSTPSTSSYTSDSDSNSATSSSTTTSRRVDTSSLRGIQALSSEPTTQERILNTPTALDNVSGEGSTQNDLSAKVSDNSRPNSMTLGHSAAQSQQEYQADAIPNGLAVTGHGIARTGYGALIDNPALTIRYEATEPAWRGVGGFSADARSQLEARGFDVQPGTNPVPPGSISYAPGISRQRAANHNGRVAEQSIADRYSQDPNARVSQQFRYDADLKPVTEVRRNQLGDRNVDVRVELDHPTDPRLNEVIEVESKATLRMTPSDLNADQVDHDAARLTRNGAMRTAGNTLENVGKIARPVGLVLDAVDVSSAFRADGNRIGMNTGASLSGIAGGGAGGWAGASAGAAIGTALMPGVGTVVGGLVGAAIGAWGGDKAGKGVFGTVAGWFD